MSRSSIVGLVVPVVVIIFGLILIAVSGGEISVWNNLLVGGILISFLGVVMLILSRKMGKPSGG